MNLETFPTYKRTLTLFERSYMFEPKMGWACLGPPTKEECENFDENFNHKSYDKAGIPRIIDQPVDFDI